MLLLKKNGRFARPETAAPAARSGSASPEANVSSPAALHATCTGNWCWIANVQLTHLSNLPSGFFKSKRDVDNMTTDDRLLALSSYLSRCVAGSQSAFLDPKFIKQFSMLFLYLNSSFDSLLCFQYLWSWF